MWNFPLKAEEIVHHISTKNILSPLLLLLFLEIIGGVPGAIFLPEYANLFVWLIIGTAVIIIAIYIAFAFLDPSRLQSEDHRIEEKRLNLLGDERMPMSKVMDLTPVANANASVAAISNGAQNAQ